MTRHPAPSPAPRCLAVAGGVSGGSAALLTVLAADLRTFCRAVALGSLSEASFDQWLVWACALAVSCCVVWLCGVALAVACAAATGRSGPRRRVPPWLRRFVLAACGVALVGGVAAPVSADPLPRPGPLGAAADLHGLPLPDRPTRATHVSRLLLPTAPHPDGSARRARTAVVAAGDCLWSLAEEALPEGASAAEVTDGWRAIYLANRAVIGPDPDLIRPGQRLRLPSS